MQVLERDIEQACYKEAKKHKCLLIKIQGTKGWPDRILLAPQGQMALLEFKRPGGVVAPLQTHILEILQRMSFRAELVYSLEQFKTILEDLLRPYGIPSHTKVEAASGSLLDLQPDCSSLLEWAKPPSP